MHLPPPAAPASDQTADAGRLPNDRHRWRAGTLVYTGAGLTALFCWLLWGDFAWNMKERAVVPMAQMLFKQFEAGDLLLGLLVTSLPAALGMLLGPIVSVYSDRHRGRWGRRIPFLLIPTPIAAAAMVGMAYTPAFADTLQAAWGSGAPDTAACRLIVFGFFWTVFEIFTVVANAVFGGLINDVVPQAVIGRFFGLFRAVSLIAGIIFNFWLIGHAEEHYKTIFISLGLLYGVGFTLMCLMVKEGEYPPPPPAASTARARFVEPLRAYARECGANPYYLWLFLALMFANVAFMPVNTFDVSYVRSIGMDMAGFGHLRVVTYSISLVLSFFLGWMADKFHPLRIGMAALLLYAAVGLWGGFCATTPATFSFAYVAHGVISGCYFTGTASIGQRLFPRAKFAQFASAAGILMAIGCMIVPPLVGKFLDETGHVYRHTFGFGGALALVGLGTMALVHRRFLALGGPQHYRAPE